MGQSDAPKLREGLDSLIQKICSGSAQDRLNQIDFVNAQCATASSVAPSKETTEPVQSPISTDSSRTQKSLRTSVIGSTTKGKDLEPYWKESCAQISSRLLLPVETDSPDSGLNSLRYLVGLNGGQILVLDQPESCPESELTADILSIIHVFSCRVHGLRKYGAKIKEDSSVPKP